MDWLMSKFPLCRLYPGSAFQTNFGVRCLGEHRARCLKVTCSTCTFYKMLRFFFFYVIGRATPLPRADRRQHLSPRRQALMGLARLPSGHRLEQMGARL